MKDAGMRIRIEPELREAFMIACRSQDVPAAQVIRTFIKDYVRQHQGTTVTERTGKKRSKVTTSTE